MNVRRDRRRASNSGFFICGLPSAGLSRLA
jgi:hypothetical protein